MSATAAIILIVLLFLACAFGLCEWLVKRRGRNSDDRSALG